MLCERRIGEELLRMPNTKPGPSSRDMSTQEDITPTLADLGIDRRRAADMQALARAPEAVIHQEVEKANAEGRKVIRDEVRQAAGL